MVHCWFLSKLKPFQYLWLLCFHDYFYDMMFIHFMLNFYVVNKFRL